MSTTMTKDEIQAAALEELTNVAPDLADEAIPPDADLREVFDLDSTRADAHFVQRPGHLDHQPTHPDDTAEGGGRGQLGDLSDERFHGDESVSAIGSDEPRSVTRC